MPVYWGSYGPGWWFAWVIVGGAYLLYQAFAYQGCNGNQECIAAVANYCTFGGCF